MSFLQTNCCESIVNQKNLKIIFSTYLPKPKFRIQCFKMYRDGITAVLGAISSHTLMTALTT